MLISNLKHPRLHIDGLAINAGECWCAFGTSRSGINEFLTLLEGTLGKVEAESLELPDSPSIISFAAQQEIFEGELRNDDSDFLDRPDPGTLAHEFLPPESLASELIDAFDMRTSLYTGYRQLSSGQSRKLLLLKALLSGSTTVILDSPYDGLDQAACRELDQAFSRLPRTELQLLVLVRNVEDIPHWCSHLAVFRQSRLAHSGFRTEIFPLLEKLADNGAQLFQLAPVCEHEADQADAIPHELISLRNGFASYGEKIIFSGLNLSVSRGRHTLVTGPNGCGKSTLLQILTGDNPKCYANDLKIFGVQRGTGESIWQLKHHMGIVSPEIHRSYRVPGTALHVVLSGLFDSIGLYQRVTARQRGEAARWLGAIDMAEHAETPFRSLSYGDQRLVLIARALIKHPPLLILDEPTQGLDSAGRRSLLDFLETVSRGNHTTILYVSHRQDEYRSFFRQHIRLEAYSR